MIITKIKSNGTEKLLSIAYRYQGKPFGNWYCDWNTVPNTLRIFHRCTTIDIKFDSFKECCKFIFSMNFIEDAERLQLKQAMAKAWGAIGEFNNLKKLQS